MNQKGWKVWLWSIGKEQKENMTTEEEKISKNRIVRIQESCKMEYSLYKPPYLTGIEGPPPKVMLYRPPYDEKWSLPILIE